MMSNFADITYNKNKHFDKDENFNENGGTIRFYPTYRITKV
jgi:hypothetical protein